VRWERVQASTPPAAAAAAAAEPPEPVSQTTVFINNPLLFKRAQRVQWFLPYLYKPFPAEDLVSDVRHHRQPTVYLLSTIESNACLHSPACPLCVGGNIASGRPCGC